MYQDLITIKGVGSQVLRKLYNNNIYNPYQAILTIPKSYDNFILYSEINQRHHGDVVTILGTIYGKPVINQFSKNKMVIFSFEVTNNILECVAFNQQYLINTLEENTKYLITGKYNFYKNQIIVSKVIKEDSFNEIIPKYNLDGISDKAFNKIVNEIINNNAVNIYETIPNRLIVKYRLLNRLDVFKKLHFPIKNEDIKLATKTLKYEEAYLFQKEFVKKINVIKKRSPINYNLDVVKTLIDQIPYELTNDQKLVVNDIFRDYQKDSITFRLIQGDVGSGKTIVALIASLGMISANKQVAFMAPTEILAKQQYQYFKKMLPNYEIELLTSSVKNKEAIKDKLKDGQIDLIVGTHAIALDDVLFNDLGLVIIDEQHKFGVNVRKNLSNKGDASLIYLTATPIPRTLAITLYGDANVSSIKEKPLNRALVTTINLKYEKIIEVIDAIKQTISRGQKAFIVVPAIDSEHATYNIENVYELLKDHNLDINTALLHGKLKENEKNDAINSFLNGNKNILLATSMVEVGIDVSSATLMVIFAAEYFGLSQLHQLRGRVGRSNLDSLCLLLSNKDDERLKLLETTNDGFVLSEFDLKLRGPGALLGEEQSGLFQFKYLNFLEDFDILQKMHSELIGK